MGIETILIATALTTAAAGGYSQYAQSKSADRMFAQNQKNAIRSTLDQYEALGAQANQRRESAGQAAQQNSLAAARARATSNAAAASSNISGLSVDAVLNEIEGQEGQNYANIAANEAFAQDQQQREGTAIQSGGQSRINSVSPGGFNPIVGLLQIGAAGGSAYAQTKFK